MLLWGDSGLPIAYPPAAAGFSSGLPVPLMVGPFIHRPLSRGSVLAWERNPTITFEGMFPPDDLRNREEEEALMLILSLLDE